MVQHQLFSEGTCVLVSSIEVPSVLVLRALGRVLSEQLDCPQLLDTVFGTAREERQVASPFILVYATGSALAPQSSQLD